jgi:hypothetical protein
VLVVAVEWVKTLVVLVDREVEEVMHKALSLLLLLKLSLYMWAVVVLHQLLFQEALVHPVLEVED